MKYNEVFSVYPNREYRILQYMGECESGQDCLFIKFWLFFF